MWTDNNDIIMQIYGAACDRKTLFPVKCPICNSRDGHFYIHRYDDNHGGIWLWCSNCHSYTHMSGIIPEWWKNPIFIDGEELEGDPEVLDAKASQIDEWINSQFIKQIDASGKSILNLKSVGHYKEMPHGAWSDLSIRDYLNKENPEDAIKICAYLDAGIPVAVSPGVTEDVLDPGISTGYTPTELTDGTWVWPGDLSYYVRNYLLKLPDDFLDNIAENKWVVPISVNDIDTEALVIDGVKLY